MREKQQKKNLCNYIPLGGKYTLFIAKLMFSHSYADWPKPRPNKRNWRNKHFYFFRYSLAVTKSLNTVIFFTTGPIGKPPFYGFQSSTVPTVSLSSSIKTTPLTSTATIESTATMESEGTTKNIMVFLRHISVPHQHKFWTHCTRAIGRDKTSSSVFSFTFSRVPLKMTSMMTPKRRSFLPALFFTCLCITKPFLYIYIKAFYSSLRLILTKLVTERKRYNVNKLVFIHIFGQNASRKLSISGELVNV